MAFDGRSIQFEGDTIFNTLSPKDVGSKEKERFFLCNTYNNTVQLRKENVSIKEDVATIKKDVGKIEKGLEEVKCCFEQQNEAAERKTQIVLAIIAFLSSVVGALVMKLVV